MEQTNESNGQAVAEDEGTHGVPEAEATLERKPLESRQVGSRTETPIERSGNSWNWIGEKLTIPARLLHAVGCASKENGRYQMDGVLIEGESATNTVVVAATDGRRLIVAEWPSGLFDAAHDVKVVMPGGVARSALKIATRQRKEDPEPMAVLSIGDKEHVVRVFTEDGEATFDWTENEIAFPPYRDIIPTWSDSAGVAAIGITPDLVASTLKTMQKLVGTEPKTKIYLPATPDRPIGFQSQDCDCLVRVLAIVMPADVGAWKEQAIKGEKDKVADHGEPELPGSCTPAAKTGQ